MLELVIEGRRRNLGGFEVGRVLPFARRRMVGPFVFFDHMGPVDFAPGLPREVDVRPHPHIGLSTITYLFEGEIMHRDSVGSEQAIRAGEVNWMTAGRGVTHSERFEKGRLVGDRLHGLQSWVALPAEAEETAPAFSHHAIEELPLPYFAVSSDLTTGRIHIHRDGVLWRALRASVALPGIMPPVTYHGHLLVDGGVMNNLPVDVMREQAGGAGPIIACDITGEVDLQAQDSRYGERPWWWLLGQRMRGNPSIISILMRSGTVGSEAQRRIVREQADYLIEPPMPNIGLRDWRRFDQAIAEGYDTTRAYIDKNGVPDVTLPPAPPQPAQGALLGS